MTGVSKILCDLYMTLHITHKLNMAGIFQKLSLQIKILQRIQRHLAADGTVGHHLSEPQINEARNRGERIAEGCSRLLVRGVKPFEIKL